MKTGYLTSGGVPVWASLSHQAQSCIQVPHEVCSFSMELPDADQDLLGGRLYGIVGCEEEKLHLFVRLLEL